MGLKKAADKDEEGTTVTHLGFVIDSDAMEVRLSQNKHDRALNAIMTLTSNKSVTFKQIDELLGFLSHFFFYLKGESLRAFHIFQGIFDS